MVVKMVVRPIAKLSESACSSPGFRRSSGGGAPAEHGLRNIRTETSGICLIKCGSSMRYGCRWRNRARSRVRTTAPQNSPKIGRRVFFEVAGLLSRSAAGFAIALRRCRVPAYPPPCPASRDDFSRRRVRRSSPPTATLPLTTPVAADRPDQLSCRDPASDPDHPEGPAESSLSRGLAPPGRTRGRPCHRVAFPSAGRVCVLVIP
jgi:hypothetical protein